MKRYLEENLSHKLDITEIRKISLEILIDVSNFCEKNGIRYFLACGTLLGCIRHQGFIPWDDDIDIMIPRPDYEKFIDEYNGKYKVCNPKNGMYFYAKVYDDNTVLFENNIDYKKYKPIGINIDVFPLDGIVKNDKVVKKKIKISSILEMLLRLSNQPIFYRKNPFKAINRIIPRIIGSKNIVKLIEMNAKSYGYDNSDYVIRYKDTPNGKTEALPKEIFGQSRMQFEKKEFIVPTGYHEWLSSFFGDYMIIPPKEKQIIHNRDAYSK